MRVLIACDEALQGTIRGPKPGTEVPPVLVEPHLVVCDRPDDVDPDAPPPSTSSAGDSGDWSTGASRS